MYCKHCGTQLEATDKFCPSCGAAQEVAEKIELAPDPILDEEGEKQKEAVIAALFRRSITGAAFSSTGVLSLIGWIMSASTRRRVRTFEEEHGELSGRALAAKIISNIGLGVGIGFTLYIALLILVSIISAA